MKEGKGNELPPKPEANVRLIRLEKARATSKSRRRKVEHPRDKAERRMNSIFASRHRQTIKQERDRLEVTD